MKINQSNRIGNKKSYKYGNDGQCARSPEWGQQVAAGVVPHPENNLTPEAVVAYCRQFLAGFKVPRRIVFLESLPQTASGKVDRQLVKQWIQK